MSLRRPFLHFRPPRPNSRRPLLSASTPPARPRMSLKRSAPPAPPTSAHAPTAAPLNRLSIARQRLGTAEFWRELGSQWKGIMKLAVVLQLGFLSMAGSMHGALNAIEENRMPTCEEWPFKARYYLRMARMPNAWNPWGPAQDADAVKGYLDAAAAVVEADLRASGFELRSEAWKGEYLKLRKALGEWYEARSEYAEARKEYEAAVAVPLQPGLLSEERVPAAVRLAKISEWAGDMPAALEALQKAVGFAYPDAIESPDGTVGLPPRLPTPGTAENTKELLDAVSELGVYLARHEQLGLALETFSRVLVRQQAGPPIPDPRRPTTEISDPCKQAATMASIGELMFALGKRDQGIVWEENAFEISSDIAEYRIACKECAIVSAENLIKMGELLQAEGSKPKGWFSGGASPKASDAEELVERYKSSLLQLHAMRAVRDAKM